MDIPEVILNHYITNPNLNQSFTKKWLERYQTFMKIVKSNEMELVDHYPTWEKGMVLLLTYSGSILLIGPKLDDKRWIEYTCIKSRDDVPGHISEEGIDLLNDIEVGKITYFDAEIIKNTSPIFHIAIP